MKIAYNGYHLTQLPDGESQKTNRVRTGTVPAAAAVAFPAIPEKSAVRYLKAIEDITSDIMSIVDSHVVRGSIGDAMAAGRLGTISAETLQREPFMPGDILIVIPERMLPGSDERAAPGSVTILRNVPFAESVDGEGIDEDQTIGSVARNVAEWLTPRETGILRSPEMEPTALVERYIISVRGGESPSPAFFVRHQDLLGKTEDFDEAGSAPMVTLRPVVRALIGEPGNARLTASSGEPHPGASRVPGDLDGSQAVASRTPSPGRNEGLLPSLLSFNLVEKVKGALSRVFPEASQEPVIGEDDGDEEAPYPSSADGLQSPTSFAAKFPGFTVRVINVQTGDAVSPSSETGIETVAERMVDLSRAVTDLVNLQNTDPESGSDTTTTQTLLKETVTRMVRDSFVSASGQPKLGTFPVDAGAFGIGIDEKGGLRIDVVVLKEALTGHRDEVVRFVHDFAGSIHDRMTYGFNPIAGVCRGGQENPLLSRPESKESLTDDEQNSRADFEKRLNELQMLLKSSYELKDSFVQRKPARQGRPV